MCLDLQEDEEILSLNTGHKLRATEAAAELGCTYGGGFSHGTMPVVDEIVRQLINLEKASCDAGVQIAWKIIAITDWQ